MSQRLAALVFVLAAACADSGARLGPLCEQADRSVSGPSAHPTVSDPALVGSYDARANAGGGYFWDRVLEYRVWFDTDRGDRFRAFARCEDAEAWAREFQPSPPVLALVHQVESVRGPTEEGAYEIVREPRNAEWHVAWLAGTQRGPSSIAEFLANPRPIRTTPGPR